MSAPASKVVEVLLRGLRQWGRQLEAADAAIVFERGSYWVRKEQRGYKVFRTGITHSTLCATIGFDGAEGLQRAVDEVGRRIAREPRHV